MRAWAQINLNHIEHNIHYIRNIVAPKTKIMAVVKADAYGHGSIPVSRVLLENGADMLAVTTIDEALELRDAGFDVPILILSPVFDDAISRAVANNITLTVFDLATAQQISEAAALAGRTAKLHIKLDTGMSRVGFPCTENSTENRAIAEEIAQIATLPHINVEGIFTHFAKADEADRSFTDLQFSRFSAMCSLLEEMGIHIPIHHVCNSAATIKFPEYHLDMVRCGIILYGSAPSDEMEGMADIRPVMDFKARVSNVKIVPEGTALSYGGTYVAPAKQKIATISVGYADGYSRILSNRAQVIINGQKAPIAGNVCMDQCMAEVSHIPDIKIGDEVIIFGTDGNNTITVESVAKLIDTINYEIVCSVTRRVPRAYIQGNKITETLNYLG